MKGTRCSDNCPSSNGRTMSFVSSASGRACLSDWDTPLSVRDLLSLLFDLKETLALARGPLIVIIAIRETVPIPANYLLSCIRATLPAILACCEELAVAVEGTSAEYSPLRASFRSAPGRHATTRLFDSLSAAFAHTQRLAPHDVLELQRHVLHHSLPPNGW